MNISPDMMKMAMDQMARMTPEQMAEMQRQVQNMSPEQMRMAQAAAGLSPDAMPSMMGGGGHPSQPPAGTPLAAAQQLKAEGNRLHTARQYGAAAEKYEQARQRIQGDSSAAGAELRKACQLNLASCYLNTGRTQTVMQLCTDVLAAEPGNRKALYRRGQAYAAQGDPAAAVPDLAAALAASPAAEKAAIAEKLAAARQAAGMSADAADDIEDIEQIEEIPSSAAVSRPVITEVTDQPAAAPTPMPRSAASGVDPAAQMRQMAAMLRSNPAMMDTMEGLMANMSQEQLDSMAAMMPHPEGLRVTPEMARQQMDALKRVQPDQLENLAAMAEGGGPPDAQRAAEMLKANPDLLKQSIEAMSSMPQEQLDAAARAAGAPPGMSGEALRAMAAELSSKSPAEVAALADQAAAAEGMAAAPTSAPAQSAAAPAASQASTAAAVAAPASDADTGRQAVPRPAVDPSSMGGMADMLASMPPEQMEQMARMSGAPPGMNFSPEMMKMAADMMKNMSPEDFQRMSAMAGAAGGMPQAGAGGAGGAPALSPDMMAQLSSPETIAMVQKMMGDMPAEDMAATMCQAGVDITPEQAQQMQQQMKRLTPKQMAMLLKTAAVGQKAYAGVLAAWRYLLARPVMLASLVVLIVAVLLRLCGWL